MNLKNLLAAPLLIALGTTLGAAPAAADGDFAPRGGEGVGSEMAASHSKRNIQPQDDVVFGHNSAALLDSGVAQVNRAAEYMKAHPTMKLVISGHANSVGPKAHNEELATKRAEMVRQHLIGHGISSDRLVVLVYGENQAQARANPIDRRAVLYATDEAPTTVASRELNHGKVITAMYTRGTTLITETGGKGKARVTQTEQVATAE